MKCENCPASWEDSSNTENGYECNDYGCLIYGTLNDECKLSFNTIEKRLKELKDYESGKIERPQFVANMFMRLMDERMYSSYSQAMFLPPFPPKKCYGRLYQSLHSSTDIKDTYNMGFREGYEKAKEVNAWNALTEDDWAKIVTRITDDSNQLFHYLEQWADTWAGDSSKLIWLRKEFGEDDRFSHSIDSRICKPILDANGVSNRRIKGYLRQNSQELNQWRDQLKSYFLNGSISSPQDLYQELERIIHSFVTPIPMSSSNIASQFGFGIVIKRAPNRKGRNSAGTNLRWRKNTLC